MWVLQCLSRQWLLSLLRWLHSLILASQSPPDWTGKRCWSSLLDASSCLFFSVAQEFFAISPRHLFLFEANDSHVFVSNFSLSEVSFKPQAQLNSWSFSFHHTSAALKHHDRPFWDYALPISPGSFQHTTRWFAFFFFAVILFSMSCRTTSCYEVWKWSSCFFFSLE